MAAAGIGKLRSWSEAKAAHERRESGAAVGRSEESIREPDPVPVEGEGNDIQTTDLNPFLPNTNVQYAWDATSIGLFKRCPRLYYYVMICGYKPRVESPHLRFGIEFHRAAEDYHKLIADGIEHEEAMFHVVKGLLYRTVDWDSEHKYKNRETLVRTVVWWLLKRPEDNTKTRILASSGAPAIELTFNFTLDSFPLAGEGQPYMLCGRLDRLVEFDGDILDEDYKTTTTTPGPYYWGTFDPDNQMSMYTLAAKVCYESEIKGVLITSAQIMLEGTRFTRGITYRTQEQLDEWIKDLEIHLHEARVYAERNYWPMRDTSCDKYGGCMFRGVCSQSPQVRDMYLNDGFVKGEKWNPLKVRE